MRWLKLPGHFGRRHAFAPAFAIVHAVVMAFAKRILAHGTSRVVGHVIDVRREEALVGLMDARGDVGPPEKRLHPRGAVVGADFEFEIRLAWMQANTVHALHATQRIMVAAPNRC